MSRPKRRPTLPSTLLLLLLSTSSLPSSTLAQEEPALTTDSLCDCYLLNTTNADGAVGTYFKHHRFFDFRNLPQHAGVPSVLKDPLSTTNARATSSYFTSDDFSNFWMLARWNNSGGPDGEVTRNDATVTMVNSPNNVYIEANTEAGAVPTEARTWLTLRTQRLEKFQTAAEIESRSNKFKFLSIRMHARTVGAPGAITAMFTYRHSDTLSQVQESDLEIRTSDARNQLHYTNQPAYTSAGELVPGATLNATMPRGKDWTAWSTHRMDWVPGETAWFVDGVETGRLSFQAPRDESTVILNAWSDGGGWTGNMSLFDAAYLQVQWVEVVFNSTDFDDDDDEEGLEDDEEEGKNNKLTEKVKRWWGGGKNKRTREEKGEEEERGCKRVCSIDETPELGRPVLLWEATESSAPAVRRIEGVTAWVPRVMVLGMVLVLTGLVGW